MQRPCRTENEKCRLQMSRFTNHAVCMEATRAVEEEQHDGRGVSALDATAQENATRRSIVSELQAEKAGPAFFVRSRAVSA